MIENTNQEQNHDRTVALCTEHERETISDKDKVSRRIQNLLTTR